MAFTYTSLEPGGQVITSDTPLDYLEGQALWVRTEGGEPAKAEPEDVKPEVTEPSNDDSEDDAPVERPAKSANRDAWVAYAKSLDIDVEGLSVKQIQELVAD